MNDVDARTWIAWLLVGMGVVFYLVFDAFAPSQVVLGPVVLGASSGECHGLRDRGPEHTMYLAVCK